jgi:hypothetical protein
VPFAPTPHPLATLVGAVGSIFGTRFGEDLFVVLGFFALGMLGWLVYALGRAWFTPLTGVVAALLVLTREPVLSYGVRAYVDIPYICLLLGALLSETRRSRAGTVPLALLPVHLALVVAAPLLWFLSDLLITGDPLHSLTGTRSTAESLGRVTGLQHVPTATPRRLGEILREPVLFGAVVGGVLSLWRLRTRAVLTGAAAGVLAIVAFAVLATAGLSILTRYLLFPATLLAIFAAAGICAWVELPREDPWRVRWMALGALTVVGLLVFIPSQVTRLKNTRHALIAQTHILDELHDLASDNLPTDTRCDVWVPNRRAVPQIALWTDRRPAQIRSAQEEHRYGLPAFIPRSQAIANEFILDASDKDKTLPPAPEDSEGVEGRYWNLEGPLSQSDRCAVRSELGIEFHQAP